MKENILFYWFIDNETLDYSKLKEVFEFCNKNGYVPKWQKSNKKDKWTNNPVKGCWSIGFFEMDNYEINIKKILEFGDKYICKRITKITKSKTDIQLLYL